MVLWVQKGRARFFTSSDLKKWTLASDFTCDEFYECPDLFELPVDGNRREVKWVLLDGAFNYWVGSFDGVRFQAESGHLQGDFGTHFYAAQTWNNLGPRIVQIGWMRVGKYPGMPFNQQMSFPCELSLRTTAEGIHLCREPVVEIDSLRVGSDSVTDRILRDGEEIQIGRRGDLFDISAEIEAPPEGGFSIRLSELDITCANGRIRCLGKEAPLKTQTSRVKLRILVDRTSIEIFANQGEVCLSFCFLPVEKDTVIRCRAEKGPVQVRSVVVHRLCSVWTGRDSGC
jgi:sucrose-6-phosphate hydrolase SacC (GH32 family)